MQERPSFILYITDQHRSDYLGCTGHPLLQTPHIDAMAREGVIFDRFYVASPMCMPNRASLMTCRMPFNHGVRTLGIPLPKHNVSFVEVLRAAGYDTALIGKSHLQTVTDFPPWLKPKPPREGFQGQPDALQQAVQLQLDGPDYQQESPEFWEDEGAELELPFYGFDFVDLATRHGTMVGADYEKWLRETAPDSFRLRGRAHQLEHDYICPQAIRTPIPEACYPTNYIADRACDWLAGRVGNPKPFFLMVSWPDPHHPFNPPGKYWDMYKPEDMPVPDAFRDTGWDMPDYVRVAEDARAKDKSLGQKAGYSIAVSEREALEARALTCGMISLVDDALGRVQNAAEQAGLRDNTVQIFTSDHGDHLGDHRLLFKGAEQYDAITHVPFIWTDPQQPRSGHSDELAQTIDIGTSILERANIEAPHGMQGQPLSIAGGGGRDCVLIHYDSQRPQQVFGEHPRAMTLIKDRWRLTIYLGDCRNELFDLADDPGEMHNLWDSPDHAGIRQQLVQRLAEEQMAVMDSAPLPVAEA